MAWGIDFPLVDLAQQLMETRLRAERLRLAQRIQSLEARAVARGVPAQSLQGLRKAVIPLVPPAPDRVDRALVLPRKASGIWRRQYLAVRSKPGSVF